MVERTKAKQTSHRNGKKTPGIAPKNATPEEEEFIRRHADGLSKTTLRATWIHSPDEHEDRPGQSLATRSHAVIKHWAEERGAEPATVRSTKEQDRPRVLRFNFPDYGGKNLQPISWDDWFKPFDERQLVFLFQEHKVDGQQSNFFRFDSPQREDA
jgi:hypothetical protein